MRVGRRWFLTVVATLVVLLSAVFLWQGLDRSDKLASVVSAISGIVALGVSIVSMLRPAESSPSATTKVEVARTGRIRRHAGQGDLNTGVRGRIRRPGSVVVTDTGSIDQDGGSGDANTGVRL